MKKDFGYVTDREGNAVAGASVYIRKQSDSSLLTLYSDNGITSTSNPLTTDNDGEYSFYTADNVIKVQTFVDGVQQQEVNQVQHYDLSAVTAFAWTILDDADAGTVRTTIGLGTGDSPQFTAVNIGAATDTTVSRASAGDIAVEGNLIYRAGGTDVPVADGGTGSSTAGGALTNLGVSAFAQTVLDDADAAAARTTLGALGMGAVTTSGLTMATSRVLGRTTASSGAIEEITVGTGLTLTGGTLSSFSGGGVRGCVVALASDAGSADYTATGTINGTAIAFGSSTETFDTDAIHDTSSNPSRMTVPSGVSKIRMQGQAVHTATGTSANAIGLQIGKNGSASYAGSPRMIAETTTASGSIQIISPVLVVTPGDYFELFFYSESDTSVVLIANQTWFAMEIVA